MNIVRKFLVLLAFCVSGSTFAQVAQKAPIAPLVAASTCTPYSIPIQSTVKDCGPGLYGSMYKTTTKVCPSGEVKESTDFDTSNCRQPPTGGGFVTAAARCRLTPGACASTPMASDCPVGQKWSLEGTGVAHCVDDDPTCPWGTSLTHDAAGHPSCGAIACPGNQVLQGDGKTCGCTVGTTWNGFTCVPPSCFPDIVVTSNAACTWGGTKYYRETTTCPSGTYGAPSIMGSWDESGCAAQPEANCVASQTTEMGTCKSGEAGYTYREVLTTCPTGPSGTPDTKYSAWHVENCAATCTASMTTTSSACGDGFTGTQYFTTHNTCPTGVYYTTDVSECGCANGGTDYPTCTPPDPSLNQACAVEERLVATSPSVCTKTTRPTRTFEPIELQQWMVCGASESYVGNANTGMRNCGSGEIFWDKITPSDPIMGTPIP